MIDIFSSYILFIFVYLI